MHVDGKLARRAFSREKQSQLQPSDILRSMQDIREVIDRLETSRILRISLYCFCALDLKNKQESRGIQALQVFDGELEVEDEVRRNSRGDWVGKECYC